MRDEDFPKRECITCYAPIRAKRRSRFCSNPCRFEFYSKQAGIHGTGLPTGTTGAIGELRVCADLLQKRFEVFRAISSSCSCDLAVLKDGKLLRVEVRTGYINNKTGKIMSNKPKAPEKFDILAIVLPNTIQYIPVLD